MSGTQVADSTANQVDVVLIGAGIMSATLGALLRQVQPDWSMALFERLDVPAAESSDPWNNAGTGHSALCELNYTPKTADGGVDVSKAIGVNEKFQVSRQWWAHAVETGLLGDPREWINPVAHVSFTHGAEGHEYLRKRRDALAGNPLFRGMEFIDDETRFSELLPLMAKGRSFDEPVALNYSAEGTDVNFGALTRQLLDNLVATGTDVRYGHEVKSLKRQTDGTWAVKTRNRHTGEKSVVRAKFVFVGAGGGALHLLQKSKIAEIRGIGGFPVSGQFLRCTNEELIEQHAAKVYGQAAVGAPPMSVPHLDTRVIDGKKGLLFGPYAGWTPKFLKQGRFTDLPRSLRMHNLPSMIGVGLHEMGLTKYLITELLKNAEKRVETLREFLPEARNEDWELITAGQRVQVIRRAKGRQMGSLEFGTAVIASADGTMSGLLGASPGASTCVSAMLDVMQACFADEFAGAWAPKLKEMIPSLGTNLSDDEKLFDEVWAHSQKVLGLED